MDKIRRFKFETADFVVLPVQSLATLCDLSKSSEDVLTCILVEAGGIIGLITGAVILQATPKIGGQEDVRGVGNE